MKTSIPNEPLDELLRDWSTRQELAAADLDVLAKKVLDGVSDGTVVVASVPTTRLDSRESNGVPQWRSAIWFALGAAAAVMIGAAAMLMRTAPASPEVAEQAEELPPRYAWLQADQLQNKAVLLREMEAVFDHQLAWLTENGEQVQVGVTDQRGHGDGQAVVVRLVVERRAIGETNWQVHWAMDVLARSEEVVHVEPGDPDGTGLHLWAFHLPDGEISVDTDLALGRVPVVKSTSLHGDATPRKVSSTQHEGFEFRVFQSATTLPSV